MGRRYGLYSNTQLKDFAISGKIKCDTDLETDAGHKDLADQVRDLFYNVKSQVNYKSAHTSCSSTATDVHIDRTFDIHNNQRLENNRIQQSIEHTACPIILGKRSKRNDESLIKILSALFFLWKVFLIPLIIESFSIHRPIPFITLYFLIDICIAFCLLYHMWYQIPETFNKIHPFIRVVFILFPYLSIIWVFVCYHGLAVALDKCSRAWNIPCRVSTGFAAFICSLYGISNLIGLFIVFCSKVHIFRLVNTLIRIPVMMEHIHTPVILSVLLLLMHIILINSVLALLRSAQYQIMFLTQAWQFS